MTYIPTCWQCFFWRCALVQCIGAVWFPNNYVGHPYCRAEMYAGRVACYPVVSHGENAVCRRDRQTDGRTPDRYITLSARCRLRKLKSIVYCLLIPNTQSWRVYFAASKRCSERSKAIFQVQLVCTLPKFFIVLFLPLQKGAGSNARECECSDLLRNKSALSFWASTTKRFLVI